LTLVTLCQRKQFNYLTYIGDDHFKTFSLVELQFQAPINLLERLESQSHKSIVQEKKSRTSQSVKLIASDLKMTE